MLKDYNNNYEIIICDSNYEKRYYIAELNGSMQTPLKVGYLGYQLNTLLVFLLLLLKIWKGT